jgi:hypothetical protein
VGQSAWAAAAVNVAVAAAAGAANARAAIPVVKALGTFISIARSVRQLQSLEAHTDAAAHNGKLGQQHHRSLLLRLHSACLAVSRPNGNPKGARVYAPNGDQISGGHFWYMGDAKSATMPSGVWLAQATPAQHSLRTED